MNAKFVLDRHNGRPTLMITDDGNHLHLRWMTLGQAEPFDVWLSVEVTEAEADAVVAQPPIDIARYVGELSDRQIETLLDVDNHPVVAERWTHSAARDLFDEILDSAARLASELRKRSNDAETTEVSRELAALSS
ncbi:hypothetical protein JNB63_11810 [Microbacterium trichothecenolyticum]|uniref:hypothetical protein n=1 Tax=Microbacterium trichothecenolyticum TaxID=69370 RepID=UPI001C6E958D|nr:hypothetical protein [Microbacterium trichothecenolyticum]MBW9120780.1 hypothetical protein [Microbacterium trichothecenolyticum]